jgi:ADP-ribose pyrophosphatase
MPTVMKSEIVYQGKVFDVRSDEVRNPDGRMMQVDVIQHGGAVVLLPIDEKKRLWLVRQYRHPITESLLELPAGTIEPGEEPETCAYRECREEIGMAPGRLTKLGEFYLAPGYSSEKAILFLAEELTHAPLSPDDDEDLHVEKYTLNQLWELIATAQLKDGKTLASVLLAWEKLNLKSL